MSKLFSLLKATMSGGLQLFNYRGKTERSRHIMPLVLGALIWSSMLTGAGAIAFGLKQDGHGTALLALFALVTSVVILMEGIYKSGDLLFKPKDNDLLLSMPIPRRYIIFTRIAKFYISEFLYCIIFLSPAIVAYAVTFEINAPLYWLVAITALLFIPIVPIALSCIIGLISSAISSRFKHKNIFQVILSFAFLILMSVYVVAINTSADFNGKTMMAISDGISKYYYPVKAFSDLAGDFNLWQYLLFAGINLAILAITILIVSSFYTKIVSRLGTVKKNMISSDSYSFPRHSQTFTMIKKEFIKYFNTPVLLVNTAMGLVLFLVAIIALCLKYDDFIGSLTSSVEDFPLTAEQIGTYLPSVNVALVLFASLMTYITATTLSLEGKAFNLLKTLPISGKKVLTTKVFAAMLIMVPAIMVGSIIMFARFHFDILQMTLVLIMVVAAPLVTELIGVLIDLRYARFNAETDAVVVKQSAGVMVATFLGLGMVLASISLLFVLVLVAGQTAGLIMMDAIFVIVAAFLYLAVATRGEEKYQKLST